MKIDNAKCKNECRVRNSDGKVVQVCVDVCPVDAIFEKNHELQIDSELCIGCGSCFDLCGDHAIIKQ